MRTRQEVFDIAARGLLSQGKQSLSDDLGGCAYRGDNGLKCAIGFCIPDDRYHAGLEGLNAGEPEIANIVEISDQDFLSDLQEIHDDFDFEDWVGELKEFAEKYDLDASVLGNA